MLILRDCLEIVIPCSNEEIGEGQFVTTDISEDGLEIARIAKPGDIVRGIAGDSSEAAAHSYDGNRLMSVFYEGEFASSYFDRGSKYRLLQDLYVSSDGIIVPDGPASARVGILTRQPVSIVGKELLQFRLVRGAVVPR